MFKKGEFVYFTANDVTYKGIITILETKEPAKVDFNKANLKKAGNYLINTSLKKMVQDVQKVHFYNEARQVVIIVGGDNNEGKVLNLSKLVDIKPDHLNDDELIDETVIKINQIKPIECASIQHDW